MPTGSGQPPFSPPSTRVRRRRRRRRRRIRVPLIGWIVFSICFLVLIAVPFLGKNAWRFKRSEASQSVSNARELVVSNSHMDAACKCIRGVLSNASTRIFNDVQIYYYLRDKNGADLGSVLALTGMVRPHSTVPFSTDAVPPSAQNFDLKEIKGIQ